MKKLNSVFFIFALVLPLVIWVLGTLVSSPIILSGFPSVILGSTSNVVLFGLLFAFFFGFLVVWYIGIPYLVEIKEDAIIIYSLRIKKAISLSHVNNVKFLYSKNVAYRENKRKIANTKWYLKDDMGIIVVGISENIAKNLRDSLQKKGIRWAISSEILFDNDEEKERFFKRGY